MMQLNSNVLNWGKNSLRTSCWIVGLLLIGSGTLLAVAQDVPQDQRSESSKDWVLVWQDDFDGARLDYSKWEVEVNAFGGGNNELQIYTDRPDNVRVADGRLILEARKDNASVQGTVREYSSGRIRSKNRGDWKFGRFEVRAKFPEGQGLWPAIWLMPTAEVYGTWAASGEIDIVEYKGQEPNIVHGTLHYGETWPNNKYTGTKYQLPQGSFSSGFHDYALEWEAGEIRWYVDGQLYQTQNKWKSGTAPFPAPFDQEFHLILNMAVGGGFVGAPNAKTPFPARMEVDHVRVFQRAGSR
ncbi:MAG: glycoside hydrolase family 16 protein [Planctomycetaceae bacterium]|nr:glycoside hydrolase family 16 protein [Planctomycetaceae bacterium]